MVFTDLFLILSLPSLSPTTFLLLSLLFVRHVFCLISPPASVIVSYLLLFAFCHRLPLIFLLFICAPSLGLLSCHSPA